MIRYNVQLISELYQSKYRQHDKDGMEWNRQFIIGITVMNIRYNFENLKALCTLNGKWCELLI